MNETKARDEISKVIAEARTRQPLRKQYPVAKHQIVKLTELGIIDLMPEKFGCMDAAMVIDAAQDKASAVFNASGEGESVPASALNEALNETEEASKNDTIKAGDTVRVKAHIVYLDQFAGAIVSTPATYQHNGYHSIKVLTVFDDGTAEVELGEMVDVVPLEACEKL